MPRLPPPPPAEPNPKDERLRLAAEIRLARQRAQAFLEDQELRREAEAARRQGLRQKGSYTDASSTAASIFTAASPSIAAASGAGNAFASFNTASSLSSFAAATPGSPQSGSVVSAAIAAAFASGVAATASASSASPPFSSPPCLSAFSSTAVANRVVSDTDATQFSSNRQDLDTDADFPASVDRLDIQTDFSSSSTNRNRAEHQSEAGLPAYQAELGQDFPTFSNNNNNDSSSGRPGPNLDAEFAANEDDGLLGPPVRGPSSSPHYCPAHLVGVIGVPAALGGCRRCDECGFETFLLQGGDDGRRYCQRCWSAFDSSSAANKSGAPPLTMADPSVPFTLSGGPALGGSKFVGSSLIPGDPNDEICLCGECGEEVQPELVNLIGVDGCRYCADCWHQWDCATGQFPQELVAGEPQPSSPTNLPEEGVEESTNSPRPLLPARAG